MVRAHDSGQPALATPPAGGRDARPAPSRVLPALIATLALGAGSAQAATVADVYQDFITDGRLDRRYDPGLLQRVISDATLNQYGDPLVTLRLRRAARQQIAGVTPPPAPPPAVPPPAAPDPPAPDPPPPSDPSAPTSTPNPTPTRPIPGVTDDRPPPARPPTTDRDRTDRDRTDTAPGGTPGDAPPGDLAPAPAAEAASPPLFSTATIAIAVGVLALLCAGLASLVARARRGAA